eukprot:Hpha_TRINITY_DN11515_c0_g3::TRINITY_DN11515_c0_g3_i1::g.32279::m.32279/K08614/ADAM28; disintegrin and metalloproteinase domain-containing protein 28
MLDRSVGIFNSVTAMYKTPPQAGSFTHDIQVVLVGHHTFTTSDPWTLAKDGNGETDSGLLLDELNAWAADNSARVTANDNHVLLSGTDFAGSTIGLAGLYGMCDGARSGNINMCTDTAMCASTVAHEMGHNFGMEHDDQGTNGCHSSDYVMAAESSSTSNQTVFSSCSADYINTYFANDYGSTVSSCLDNKPVQVFGDPYCGNGFVEDGEDCDCGLADCSSLTSCCDGSTCKFMQASYQCSEGPCCTSCMFITAASNTVCREAVSDCDIADKCPGDSGDCSPDAHMYAGKACTRGGFSGGCFGGQCASPDFTCQQAGNTLGSSLSMTEMCRPYNDVCGYLVCHNDTTAECDLGFRVDNVLTRVPEGSPCSHASDISGQRTGLCYKGACVVPESTSALAYCGNGFIDWGEQCDCGIEADSCCECATCRLKAGNQCSSKDGCCNNCQLATAGTICRGSTVGCDVEEVCDGTVPICPADQGAMVGTSCLYGDASLGSDAHRASNCYKKTCVKTTHEQCKAASDNSREYLYANYGDKNVLPDMTITCQSLLCCYEEGGFTYCGSVGGGWYSWGDQKVYLGPVVPTGLVLSSDTSSYCARGDPVAFESSPCAADYYYQDAAAKCVACAAACQGGCTGPRASDCTSCKYGKDSRGVCATEGQWADRVVSGAVLWGGSSSTSAPSPGGVTRPPTNSGTQPPTPTGATRAPTPGNQNPPTNPPTNPGTRSPTPTGATRAPTPQG